MKVIYLIGYMGSGKTTLGRAVAARTGMPFIDLDDYIEEHEKCSIRDIFARHGEDYFRALEREALERLASGGDADGGLTLVACGGGTPCFGDNMDVMNRRGVTVFLDAPHESLLRRLKEGRAMRPLIAALDDEELDRFIRSQMEWRRPHYGKARLSMDSSRLESPDEVAASVDEFLKIIEYGHH
ncbi:MAG: AAA family ATPase [Duncaniella sp.]|nr:AAA family ATPase [Duncaniella sp.]